MFIYLFNKRKSQTIFLFLHKKGVIVNIIYNNTFYCEYYKEK